MTKVDWTRGMDEMGGLGVMDRVEPCEPPDPCWCSSAAAGRRETLLADGGGLFGTMAHGLQESVEVLMVDKEGDGWHQGEIRDRRRAGRNELLPCTIQTVALDCFLLARCKIHPGK